MTLVLTVEAWQGKRSVRSRVIGTAYRGWREVRKVGTRRGARLIRAIWAVAKVVVDLGGREMD